jgi:energy-converting hydrogenase B subunit Q
MADDRPESGPPSPTAESGLPDLLLPEAGRLAARLSVRVGPGTALLDVLTALKQIGADITSVTVFRATKHEPGVERVFDVELRDVAADAAAASVEGVAGVVVVESHAPLGRIFGKRVIVIGGGAQVAQVALGAVSEADRHNLRGERISVDTIALVGEETIAATVRAVADLPRAHILVLAGSIMGGEITRAVREIQAAGIPVVALNMVGSVTDAADLVVTDPVQAGTMAVMAIADTAHFSIERQRGRRY